MIGKVLRGSDPAGLLRYLFGPGRCNEHCDQHVVAHWTGQDIAVTRGPGGGFDVRSLVADLNTDLITAGLLGQPKTVWHCSVSLPARDGQLSDAQWRAAAEQIIAEVGLEDERAGAVCWLAVRHGLSAGGNDHIHLVAALAGRTAHGQVVDRRHVRHDYAAIRRVCTRLERAWDLSRTSAGTGAAHQLPQRAEREIAARTGRALPQRVRLERAVRSAAVASRGPAEFTARLAREGIHATFTRPSARRPGTWLGVTFTTADYLTRDGHPVAFSGRKLASDLTAPALHHRWDTANHADGLAVHGGTGQAIARLADLLRAAPRSTTGGATATVPQLRGHVRRGADALWAAAEAVEADRGGPWHTAASEAARAAREPGDVDPAAGHALTTISRGLAVRPRAQSKAEVEMARAHDFFRRLLAVWAAHDTGEPARVAAATAQRMATTTSSRRAGPAAASTRNPVAHTHAPIRRRAS